MHHAGRHCAFLLVRVVAVTLMLAVAPTLAADDAAPTLRILSYNIKHGRGMDGEVDLRRAAAVIERVKPDLVALQEIDHTARRSGEVDEAARLGELTGMHHAFGSFFDFDGGQYGMAILSRWPLTDVKNHRLPDGAEPRTSLAAEVRPFADRPPIVFANVHFYRTEAERLAQARAVLTALGPAKGPTIVAGDFNSRPDSAVLRLFGDGWTVPPKDEDHFTFPSDKPSVEIDYIVFRPASAFVVERIDVLDEPVASDHRPLLLEVSWPEAADK